MDRSATNNLVIFTLQFPYGKAETFLETEIIFLSAGFSRIYIVPSSNRFQEAKRKTPDNVVVIDSLAENCIPFSLKESLPFLTQFFKVWLFSFWNSSKKINYLRFINSLIHHYYNEISKKKSIESIIKQHNLSDALFYDYWMSNSLMALLALRKDGMIKKLVCRAHRFDLYDEANPEGIMPFREFKVTELDSVYTISKHGYKYLLDRTSTKYHEKISLHYLGINKPVKTPVVQGDPIVVSCSNLLPLKQVDKIAEALREVKVAFTWIHFGEGPQMEYIKQIVKEFPRHIKVQLMGFVPNAEILKFYETHYVSCFISLSISEGLPVSMMEAQSFGIPIIAPSVYGVPEIVLKQTGCLLKENCSRSEVTTAIEYVLSSKINFDREVIRKFFDENFDADKNYKTFVFKLLAEHGKKNF